MTVVTRFAPSPTGYLHIGGARTALFNYLYAKNKGGKFLLRIEDTDTNRSTKEAVDTILNGLSWLGITNDDEIVYQMQRQERHIEVAKHLLKEGKAYKCYCSKEELEKRREDAQVQGRVYIYEGKCRELKEEDAPKDIDPVIRLKVDKDGKTVINDDVMGKIEVNNKQLDDFIILRSNGIPTYLFAVVVDDHDMAITKVIRGDDHLTNTFRQYQVYKACGWSIPEFAHLPLIHSQDGAKMSKRHGAVSVESYKDLGFLPEAIRNYLLRLGWSHGNDEIISDSQAIEWFDIKDVNKSPARFDITKLTSVNSHYIKQRSNESIVDLIEREYLDNYIEKAKRNIKYREYLIQGLDSIKERSKTILEIIENSLFYITKEDFTFSSDLKEILISNKELVLEQIKLLGSLEDFSKDNLNATFKDFAKEKDLKLGEVVKFVRILLCGKMVSPASVFEIMAILGQEETLKRLNIIKNI